MGQGPDSPNSDRSRARQQGSSSLSRPASSSGLMTSCCHPFCAPADDATRGSRFSSRSASGRLMIGWEGWGGNNLKGALAANQRQDRETLRTHPIRRPREDIFLPEQNALSPRLGLPAFSAAASGNRRNRGAALAPAELATVDPHPVQNHGQAPGDRDDGSTYPAPLSHPHAPRFQPRPFPAMDKQ